MRGEIFQNSFKIPKCKIFENRGTERILAVPGNRFHAGTVELHMLRCRGGNFRLDETRMSSVG